MRNDESGEIAATVVITGVHMDTQARAACPFPAEIVSRGKQMIVEITPVT
jgi:acyl-CoA thioester hydrolase